MEQQIKGYKVFNPDWTCREFQYKVGETYTHEGDLGLCEAGFHFCKKLTCCFSCYVFDPTNKVAEVVALGDVIEGKNQSVTNKIKIVRELSWHEVLDTINTGRDNTGNGNTGNGNTGNWNVGCDNTGDNNVGNTNAGSCNIGDCNAGDWNTGNFNTGDWNLGDKNPGDRNVGSYNTGYYNTGNGNTGNGNTGNYNAGNFNTGIYNTGDFNTGDANTGNYNTGIFNTCNYSNGLFNTKAPKITLFNKPTDLTFEEFTEKYAEACDLLNTYKGISTQWVRVEDMTDQEKKQNPDCETTGGFLKTLTYEEACQKMWNAFTDKEKAVVLNLPNFDKKIFLEITGIDIRNE